MCVYLSPQEFQVKLDVIETKRVEWEIEHGRALRALDGCEFDQRRVLI
jgi:hypothetical protein